LLIEARGPAEGEKLSNPGGGGNVVKVKLFLIPHPPEILRGPSPEGEGMASI